MKHTAVRSAFRRGHVNVTCHPCRGYIGTVKPEAVDRLVAAHHQAEHPDDTTVVGRRIHTTGPGSVVYWERQSC